MCQQAQCEAGVKANLQAAPYNCAQGDIACYCAHPEYAFGIRDCTAVVCTNPADRQAALQAASQMCMRMYGHNKFRCHH